MRTTHLTDKEIQQYVTEGAADASIRQHINSCERCSEMAAAYRVLITGLRDQPAERFDFSVTDLVMQQLTVPAPASKGKKENVLIYAFITAGAAIVVFALYFFRKYMSSIFESMAPVFINLALTAFMTLSIFLITDMYKKYKKKIHILDIYRGN